MKTFTTLLTLALTLLFSLHAAAQDVAGSWQAQTVSGVEPPKGASLTLAFGEESTATVTYSLGGESQSWKYKYAVTDGQLTLEAIASFGEPKPITYDIKFDEGKLLLLSPKPKPADEDADKDATDAADEKPAEEAAEGKEEEKTEEEDTRVPVWVLIKA